jgi:hypothetical protein
VLLDPSFRASVEVVAVTAGAGEENVRSVSVDVSVELYLGESPPPGDADTMKGRRARSTKS